VEPASGNPLPEGFVSFIPAAGKILDAGCYVNSVLFALQDPCKWEFVASDFQGGLKQALRAQAASRLSDLEWEKFIRRTEILEGENGDIRNFEFAENTFAAVIARDVLHFITAAERKTFVARAMESLAPGGILLIRLHRKGNPVLENRRIWKNIQPDEYQQVEEPFGRCFPATLNEIRELSSGFQVIAEFSEFDDGYFFEICLSKPAKMKSGI